MSIPIRVLIVEDSPDDTELVVAHLREGGYAPCYVQVDTATAMRAALDARPWDMVIADYFMPSFSAPAALQLLRERDLDLPFIIVSGKMGEDIAVTAMKAGAHDYLMKDNLARLVPAIERELREAEVRRERRRAEQDLEQSFQKLQSMLEGTVQTIATMTEMRDPYTAGHQRRVSELARIIAREMGLSKEQIEGIQIAGLLHDIGKVAVPIEILSKPGRINEHEMNLVRTHPQIGFHILQDIEFPWPVARIVLEHHERLDGSGYPAGLTGAALSLEVRILSVADVLEAMSSHRPYRPALGMEQALQEIMQNRGALYDPDVVDVCTVLFHKQSLPNIFSGVVSS